MRHLIEKMFFSPKWYHYPIIVLLLPLSLVYGIMMSIRRKITKNISYGLPIISVGNLIVGGSGKTPFVIAVASRYKNVVVISRGYGRQSSGLVEVSRWGEIVTDVYASGDEAMLMAQALANASVIVSEDRHKAILKAKTMGAEMIILDDAFSNVSIQKFDILLEPDKILNYYTFPSGPHREFISTRKYADIVVKEKRDFHRKVSIENTTSQMVLVTAISNPKRLEDFLPHENIVHKVYYDDHAYFDENTLANLLKTHQARSLLCTSKDKVKMQGFKLPISEMKLELEIAKEIYTQIDKYIEGYKRA